MAKVLVLLPRALPGTNRTVEQTQYGLILNEGAFGEVKITEEGSSGELKDFSKGGGLSVTKF